MGQDIVEQAPRPPLVSVVYWLRLQGGGRGLRQTKKADELTNVLLEQEDFFSSVTRHPKIQRWAAENYVPDVVTRELDQLRVNSKIFGKFDPDTSATDIRLLLKCCGCGREGCPPTIFTDMEVRGSVQSRITGSMHAGELLRSCRFSSWPVTARRPTSSPAP